MSRTTDQEQVAFKLSRLPTCYRLIKAQKNSGPHLEWEQEGEPARDRQSLVGLFFGITEPVDQSGNLKRQEERDFKRQEMHGHAEELFVLSKCPLRMSRSKFDHRIFSNIVVGLTERVDIILKTRTIWSENS